MRNFDRAFTGRADFDQAFTRHANFDRTFTKRADVDEIDWLSGEPGQDPGGMMNRSDADKRGRGAATRTGPGRN
jgi:hypothetical protein